MVGVGGERADAVDSMTVIIDPAGGSADLFQLLPRGGSELADLTLVGSNNRADAAWFGNGPDQNKPRFVGVERKRLGDALQCMQDGRLVEQLRGLVQTFDHVWILIEEEIRSNPQTGLLEKYIKLGTKTVTKSRTGKSMSKPYYYKWVSALYGSKRKLMWRDFHHWLCTLTTVATELTGKPVRLWFTRSARETSEWIWSEYNWWQKPWREHKSLEVFDVSHQRPKQGMMIKPPLEARLAKEFDGFGWDRSLAAADQFSSPREMANATVDQWLEVDGVGKKLAESMVRQWTRERTLRRRK